LCDLNGGAGAGAVVAPGVDGFERSDFALHGFGAEAEDFVEPSSVKGRSGTSGCGDGGREDARAAAWISKLSRRSWWWDEF